MTIHEAIQAALDTVFYAQSVLVRDAPSGELTQSWSTCLVLSEAVAAAHIAAVERTARPARAAHAQMRGRKA